MSGQADRDRVLEATDLVALIGEHVALRPRGREHLGLCPFHDDRSPSLAVVTHKGNAFYKCFACGAAGNAIDFMMNYHRLDFPEALRHLARRAGIELRPLERRAAGADADPRRSRQLLLAAHAMAQRFFLRALQDPSQGAAARDVLARRGLEPASAERFGLGAAPPGWDALVRALAQQREHEARSSARGANPTPPMETFEAAGLVRAGQRGPIDGFRNRLTFPICDDLGNPVAFGARAIDPEDNPKYLNSPESPIFHKGSTLYAVHLARRAIIESRTAIVCEGYTDVIACHRAGFGNAVGTLGTAFTEDHARRLLRLGERVILLFDGDEAGLKAAERAVEVFIRQPVDVLICTLPDGLDPDELLGQPEGATRFRAALDASVDSLRFLVDRFRSHWRGAMGLGGRQQRLEALLQRLADLGVSHFPGVRKRLLLGHLSDLTSLPADELERALAAIRPAARREASAVSAAEAAAPVASAPSATAAPRDRARHEAERNLLALLLAAPELAAERVSVDDEPALPLTEAFTAESFSDASHSRVAALLFDLVESGNRPSIQQVLADLEHAVDKRTASDLFSMGSARLEPAPQGAESPSARIRQAALDLDRLIRLDRFDPAARLPDVPLDADTAAARLEQIRRSGPRAAAIARFVRANPASG